MEKAKIQDAGLRMKLQHDNSKIMLWLKAQLSRLVSPIDLRAFRTRQIRFSSLISGRANFAGRERPAVSAARRHR